MWKAVFVGAVLAATAAVAQSQGARVDPNGDPNQIVCVNERVTGSRVATQRVCRTRREWEEHKGEMRKTLEKVQYFKPQQSG
jgi:hypothetical protein